MDTDLLIFDGGEVKALGGGRIGGYAVLYGDPSKPDLSPYRDFYTDATDFGIDEDEWGKVTAPLLMNHGLDPEFKGVRIGQVTYQKKAAGIWAEGTLKARRGYEAKYADHIREIESLIEQKAFGLSTGVPGHMVQRKKVGDAHWLEAWPLDRSELSLTATPCEPRTLVVSLKSLIAERDGTAPEAPEEINTDGVVAAPTLLECSARLVADLDELVPRWERAYGARKSAGRDLSPEKLATLAALKSLATRVAALADAAVPRPKSEEIDEACRLADELLAMQM